MDTEKTFHTNLEIQAKEDDKSGVENRVVISYTMDMANEIILALANFLILDSDGENGGTSARLKHKPFDLKQLFELDETQNIADDTNKKEPCFLKMAYKVIVAALNKHSDWYGKIKPSAIFGEVRRMFIDIVVSASKLERRSKNEGNNDEVINK